MKHEHPSVEIDQTQQIPDWALRRLFDMGVMGMTVPEAYGGLGLGVTAYNRALEVIGRYCCSTSVVVSAHQSIGCKAIMLFGNEAQKAEYLPKVAREYLSAFCLSEPQVGSDAAGQETTVTFDEATQEYVLNGEKKWSTSGAIAGLFTVLAKHRYTDPKTGKQKDGVTALIVTPDMPGVNIFEKNRSKTGIRGTWQARVRFTNVRVPKANRLHDEGRGLNVALTCLNFGRCTSQRRRERRGQAGLRAVHEVGADALPVQPPARRVRARAPRGGPHERAHLRDGRDALHDDRHAGPARQGHHGGDGHDQGLLLALRLAGHRRRHADHGRRGLHDRERVRAHVARQPHPPHRGGLQRGHAVVRVRLRRQAARRADDRHPAGAPVGRRRERLRQREAPRAERHQPGHPAPRPPARAPAFRGRQARRAGGRPRAPAARRPTRRSWAR